MATTASTTATTKKSVSETGHNKNVANFSKALTILEEMGTDYKPSNSKLLIANLQPKEVALAAKIKILNDKKPIYKNAVADREGAIAKLGPRTTSALNYSKSIEISATDKENIANQVKKIRGDKKPKAINPNTAEEKEISTSQMSYDNRIANFETLISQFASHSEYAPNETDITIASLKTFHTQLATLNTLVDTTGNSLITARKDRNQLLYEDPQNIIAIIKDIKNYVKSIGAIAIPYYKALVKLKFVDIKKED